MKNVGCFFDYLIDKHGHSIQALDYGSKESQELKFKMISEATDFNYKSVLDIGCGFCDLKDYLDDYFASIDYLGVDVSEKVVEKVEKEKMEINVLQGTWPMPIAMHDIIIMNGVLYLYPFREALKLIEEAWLVTRELLIFDCLSAESLIPDGKGEYHFDAGKILSFVFLLTPYICLRHDTSKNFFMMHLYRNGKENRR
ncbi:MAG: class I SAM-dependent methyltransferase [Pseudomonadota bacterium]